MVIEPADVGRESSSSLESSIADWIPSDHNDDVYFDMNNKQRVLKEIYPLHVIRRPANKA
jgi:hypothetical protein